MPSPLIHSYGGFSYGKKTAAANTAFVRAIWPYANQGSAPVANKPGSGIAHITSLIYKLGTTEHTLTLLRPLNWTTFSADAAASQAVVNLTANPGAYATVYKYPLANGQTAPRTADNLLAASDHVVYQAADGTWVYDTVSSIATLAVTLATNVPTGGVKAGGLLYHFGITTDVDPATGEAHPQFDVEVAASATIFRSYTDPSGLWHALHAGDPILLHSANATAQGWLECVSGFHGRH